MEFQNLFVIIRDIIRISRGSIETQSETISDRQVEHWINQYRAQLIKQDIDKGRYPNPSYIQELYGTNGLGIKLVPVDITESTKTIGRYVLRSTVKIPKLVDFNYKSGITYIGTLDGREIQLVPQGRTMWQQYKKYTANTPIAYLKNQYLYVENGDILEYIKVRGVFEVPVEAEVYNTGDAYDTHNFKYPIPYNMLGPLKELILKRELGVMLTETSDTTNNADNNNLNDKTTQK